MPDASNPVATAPESTVKPEIPIADASETEADLQAKIDEELGLPAQPKTEEPAPDEETPETPDAEPEPSEPAGEEDSEEAEPETPEEVETPKPSEPGTPSDDLSIEVVDIEGVTHKISTIEDLPKDFEPAYNRQIIEIVSQLAKLDAKREDLAHDAEVKAEADALAASNQETFASWDKEAAELVKAGRLKESDTERLDAVFGHMVEINAKRAEAGNPNFVTSLEDALDKFEAKEAKEAADLAKKNENDTAKKKAGLVGRSSAAANSDTFVYRSGMAKNIDDVPLS